MVTLAAEAEQNSAGADERETTTRRLLVDSGFAADDENARFLIEMGVVRIDRLSDGDWLVNVCGRQTLVRHNSSLGL
jgi:hypothetical protein